jgi:multidrug transporter EmrE-like cation transporter
VPPTKRPATRRWERIAVTAAWLGLFVLLNTLAAACFKESGTDLAHTWRYFFLGNTFGPLSVIFLMIVYSRMNANLTSALSTGFGTIAVQITFWMLYGEHLRPWQWGGIGLLTAGVMLAMMGKTEQAKEPGRPEGPA